MTDVNLSIPPGLFICIVIGLLLAGIGIGVFFLSYSIPSCKLWESQRAHDHILIADDVVCTPMNESNATYYRYDTVAYNGTEYIVQKQKVGNKTAKGIIVCGGGKG